jgi:sulfite reductase alpha subunit-like flavoprotein
MLQDDVYVPRYHVNFVSDLENYKDINLSCTGYINNIEQLTSNEAVKKVLQIEIFSNKEIKYKPGDIAILYTENDIESVELILKLINLTGDEVIEITTVIT